MKKVICYLLHERSRGRWEKWHCHNYISTCGKCGRNHFTQAPGLWEIGRVAIVIVICVLILVAIRYLPGLISG